jgi:iron complex transport system ATP-binding protein
MLSARDVSFSYGRQARTGPAVREAPGTATAGHQVLEGVSVDVGRGDLVGILGPNGSGKTTLLKLLCGALAPTTGAVVLEGRRVADWPRRQIAQRVALVPQETHAAFDFSVLDIVLMGRFPYLGPFALEGPDDLVIARQALAATGTAEFESRAFGTLSGGEKQRVVIASALAQAPALLLLDEPTASLDIGHQIEVQTLLRRLNQADGVTMILSTHDLNLAAALCRRLVLLRDGRVLAAGPTEEVLTPAAIRDLYGVHAEVAHHPRAGHLSIVPIGRA